MTERLVRQVEQAAQRKKWEFWKSCVPASSLGLIGVLNVKRGVTEHRDESGKVKHGVRFGVSVLGPGLMYVSEETMDLEDISSNPNLRPSADE